MKKSLIAMAVLAASGAAMAQSSVTLFGVLDLGYENVKTQAGRISGISPSANNSSRLGFKGTEDLGGGLAASFHLEAALNPANGTGSSGTSANNQSTTTLAGGLTFNRRSTLSLSGNFGELRIGRDYVPSFWNTAIFDPFGANSVGATLANYTLNGGTGVRASNSIGYFLPGNLGGFYGQGMYAFGNRANTETAAGYTGTVNTQDNGRYIGLRAGYAQGPIDVAAAYGKTNFAAGTQSVALGNTTLTHGNTANFNLGGSYDFGVAKAMGTITNQKYEDVAAAGVNKTIKGWSVGVNAPVGAGNVLAQYSAVKLDGAKADKWSFGYTYNLSKRTAVYGIFARVGNSGGSSLAANSFSSGNIGFVPGAVNTNQSSTGFGVGLRTSF
ncbi:MAG: porin [Curvibacter sp.]|nr:MAG: porin [Curvibacter sp.]